MIFLSAGDAPFVRLNSRGGTAAEGSTTVPFFFLFGDYQGSAQLMMSNEADPSTATIQRDAHTPYGAQRDFDPDGSAGTASANPLTIERGWLSQVADEATTNLGTGLTYLNARYYDPVASRFISPDPMLDVMDPKTLDPYRYAENNPVFYSDASGLRAIGQYDCAGDGCEKKNHGKVTTANPEKAKKLIDARWREEQAGIWNFSGNSAANKILAWIWPDLGSPWSDNTVMTGTEGLIDSLKKSQPYQVDLRDKLDVYIRDHGGIAPGDHVSGYWNHFANESFGDKERQMLIDLGAILTGDDGLTNNEGLAFFGNHNWEATVTSVDGNEVRVQVHAFNTTTMASATRYALGWLPDDWVNDTWTYGYLPGWLGIGDEQQQEIFFTISYDMTAPLSSVRSAATQ